MLFEPTLWFRQAFPLDTRTFNVDTFLIFHHDFPTRHTRNRVFFFPSFNERCMRYL